MFNLKIFLFLSLSCLFLYFYVFIIISITTNFDKCILKKYDDFCFLESTTDKKCFSYILDKNDCEKYSEMNSLKCISQKHNFFNFCRLFLQFNLKEYELNKNND